MKNKLFTKRRKVRETLLTFFYAQELSGESFELLKDNLEAFFELLLDAGSFEVVDLIRDELITVFEDARTKKLDQDSLVFFNIPFSEEEIETSFVDLDAQNSLDNFYSYAEELRVRILKGKKKYNFFPRINSNDQVKEIIDSNYDFFVDYIEKYGENLEEVDSLIKESLKNWDFSRLTMVDKVLIRMGIVEIKYLDGIPPRVSINECIELAKKYSTPKSSKFINGILNTVKNQ